MYDNLHASVVSTRVRDPINVIQDPNATQLSDTIGLRCKKPTCIYTYYNDDWHKIPIPPLNARIIRHLYEIRKQPKDRCCKTVTELAECICATRDKKSALATVSRRLSDIEKVCKENDLPPLIVKVADEKRCFNPEL